VVLGAQHVVVHRVGQGEPTQHGLAEAARAGEGVGEVAGERGPLSVGPPTYASGEAVPAGRHPSGEGGLDAGDLGVEPVGQGGGLVDGVLEAGLVAPVGALEALQGGDLGVDAAITGDRDVDTLTEVLWAALYGLTTLSRNDRLRPGHDTDRIDLLVAQFRTARTRHLSAPP
jgi:hypothetical protein